MGISDTVGSVADTPVVVGKLAGIADSAEGNFVVGGNLVGTVDFAADNLVEGNSVADSRRVVDSAGFAVAAVVARRRHFDWRLLPVLPFD